mmetsp:Transcript_48874/g.114762  ORF Transcript_48874/g.114762 Transcript_48874/m.114762 type:complete len:210 (+) Transcript_48874:2-631(+)
MALLLGPYRVRRGMRREELSNVHDVHQADSSQHPLGLQEVVQVQLRLGRTDYDAMYRCPEGADEAAWQLEHMRQFSLELNQLTVALDEVCSKLTCPVMKATDEWLFLCAAHKKPQECSAIDYIIHTLDGTAALLNSNKWFPSRVTIPASSLTYYKSIARRLYRVFSHAFFHHREAFDIFEVMPKVLTPTLCRTKLICASALWCFLKFSN